MSLSTLTGWLPEPGSYVWQQMYSPFDPSHNASIEERIALGNSYCSRRLMRVLDVTPYYDTGLWRFHTVDLEHRYTEATIQRWLREEPLHGWFQNGMSATESNWCALEEADAQQEAGVLF